VNLKELIRSVRRIQFKTQNLTHQNRLGEVSSSFKGFGMSFSEVREYQFGDETRFIDWNVTARYNRPHVKVFEEEREQVNLLLIDVSKSMDFGGAKRTKKQLIVELYATIAFSCALNKDKVGVLFFSDKVERYFEPKSGIKNIWMIAMQLIEWKQESNDSDLQEPLRFIRALKLKRFRLFVLSDFHFDRNTLQKEALIKTKRKNRVYVLNVRDRMESKIPLKGFYQLIHSESGLRTWHNGFSKRSRDRLLQFELDSRQYWKNECRKNKIHYMELTGDVDVFKKLNGLM
tara:strand:+ start:1093 stop:1956 length:864 start_codon:yes stop_codon:yes gene_type:complete